MNDAPLFDVIRAEVKRIDPGARLSPEFVAKVKAALLAGMEQTVIVAPPAPCAPAGPIDLIDAALLRVICPERTLAELEPWVDPIRAACARFEINTIRRIAAFVAQMAHESGLKAREEDLNYSAKRLAEVWSRFAANPSASPKERQPNNLARACAHNPEKLANVVYANRMGNGPPESGDGWRHRGVGPLQNTGKQNHERFAEAMGMSLADALTYMRTVEGGIMAAAWFWEANDINRLADTPGVADESRAINGGENGLADRERRFNAGVAEMLRRERVA